MRALTLSLVAAVTTGCHHDAAPVNDQPAKDQPSPCADKLTALVSFFTSAAAEQAASPERAGVREAEMESMIREDDGSLVGVEGKPSDVTKSDYLIVGPSPDVSGNQLVSVDGTARRIGVEEPLIAFNTPSLVIAVSPKTPWRHVKAVYAELRNCNPDARYANVAFAYEVGGVFVGRTPPAVDDFRPDAINIPALGDHIAKDTSVNCPEVAVTLASLQQSGRLDASLLLTLARDLPKCRCTTNFALLETIPWLVRRRLITTVPLREVADAQPTLPVADDNATFAEVVRANGGRPLAIGAPRQPSCRPPPPPPPRPRH